MPGACFTVLHFWKLRYKMLARPIALSLWHCVKDNVVLQASHHSTNCWYTKPKWTILQPLKGEIGFELIISKFSNFWIKLLCIFKIRVPPFLHGSFKFTVLPSLYDSQCCCLSMLICYILPSDAFTITLPKLFVHVFNRELMDASLGFLREQFSMTIENDILSPNDVIARSVKT